MNAGLTLEYDTSFFQYRQRMTQTDLNVKDRIRAAESKDVLGCELTIVVIEKKGNFAPYDGYELERLKVSVYGNNGPGLKGIKYPLGVFIGTILSRS